MPLPSIITIWGEGTLWNKLEVGKRRSLASHYTTVACASYTGCQSRDEWSLTLRVLYMYTSRYIASLAPTYLTTDIHLVSEYGRRPLRSSTDMTLTVPRTHNRFGDRSFAVAGPRLWNSLPISLRQISSYGQFRRYLKNHLFGIWEITARSDAWFSTLYKYSYLLTYLLTLTTEGHPTSRQLFIALITRTILRHTTNSKHPQLLCIRRPDFLSRTNILAAVGHLPVFLTVFSLHMCRNSSFRAFGQNSDIAVI